MKRIERLGMAALAAAMLLGRALPAQAAVRTTAAGGYWTNTATWVDGGTLGLPAAGDTVVLGHAVTLDQATPELALFTNNAALTFNGTNTQLRAATVVVNNTITHPAQSATSTNAFGAWVSEHCVWITCSNLTVLAGKSIDANAKGYAGGTSGSTSGKGPGGATATSNVPPGGSHGGRGGGMAANTVYGVASAPLQPGSGGAYSSASGTAGGAGGGAIRIDATGRVLLEGTVRANGGNGAGNHSPGGAGGSIWISCRTIEGTNLTITANGGNYGAWLAGYSGFGGGGGRIAITYDAAAQAAVSPKPAGTLSASEGHGNSAGAHGLPGTLYVPDQALIPMPVQNGGFEWANAAITNWSVGSLTLSKGWLRFPAGFSLTVSSNLTIAGDTGVDTSYGYMGRLDLPAPASLAVGGNLAITNRGALYAYAAATNGVAPAYGGLIHVSGGLHVNPSCLLSPWSHNTNGGAVMIRTATLRVDSGGQVNADSAGFRGGAVGENGYGPGRSLASSRAVGAGYGGAGGGNPNSIYGSSNVVTLAGSGVGGGDLEAGPSGGGLIWIDVSDGSVLLNGTMTANGGNSSQKHGGGSGGGIYIRCKRFAGAGILRANGGNNGSWVSNVGGGGGRIAVWRQIDTSTLSSVTVNGGSTGGGVGSVFWGQIPASGTLITIR